MSINMALLRAFCSSWVLTYIHFRNVENLWPHGLCSITQHALSPARQNLGHLASEGADLLVLHEIFLKATPRESKRLQRSVLPLRQTAVCHVLTRRFVREMAQSDADGKVEPWLEPFGQSFTCKARLCIHGSGRSLSTLARPTASLPAPVRLSGTQLPVDADPRMPCAGSHLLVEDLPNGSMPAAQDGMNTLVQHEHTQKV